MAYKSELQSNNTDLQGILDAINELPEQQSLADLTADANAMAGDIANGKTAYVNGAKLTGNHTCPTVGQLTADANAGTGDILSGKTAYVNGSKLTGTHACKTLAEMTADADATAANILASKIAYVDGVKVTGTMPNNGAVSNSLNCGGSYTIPAGYHNGSGRLTANSLSSQTSATATAGDILSGKTAYVNGSKLTGTFVPPTLSPVHGEVVVSAADSMRIIIPGVSTIQNGMIAMQPYSSNVPVNRDVLIRIVNGVATGHYYYGNGGTQQTRTLRIEGATVRGDFASKTYSYCVC